MQQEFAATVEQKNMNGPMNQMPGMNLRSRSLSDHSILLIHHVEPFFGHALTPELRTRS